MEIFKKLGILLLFLACLIFPDVSIEGSKAGLCLWYEKLLPVLFPGMIFGGMMKRTGISDCVIRTGYPFIRWLFPCSYAALFVIFSGFLCGYPMAALLANKFWQRGELSDDEFHYCMSFANLPGPVFLTGFVLKNSRNTFQWLALFYGMVLLVSQVSRLCFLTGRKQTPLSFPQENPPFFLAFQEEIYQAATSLVQIAAILMICSMLIRYGMVFIPRSWMIPFSGMLEMSTGIQFLFLEKVKSYELFSLFLAGFGGLSVTLQIFTVASTAIKNTRYTLREYLVFKAFFLFLFAVSGKLITLLQTLLPK